MEIPCFWNEFISANFRTCKEKLTDTFYCGFQAASLFVNAVFIVRVQKQHQQQQPNTFHPTTSHEGPETEQMYSCTLSLTSALDRCGWSSPRSGRFTPGERPVTHCIEGSVGPRTILDGRRKSRPHRNSIPEPSSPQPFAIPTELSRLTRNIVSKKCFRARNAE